MPTSLFLAGWTAAVVLCLYSLHCFWEAHRADLAAVVREHMPHSPAASPSPTAFRARGWVALAASATLGLAVPLLAR